MPGARTDIAVKAHDAPSDIRAMGCRYLRCATYIASLPVSTPFRIIVNRCWSGFPCKWRYINVENFNLPFNASQPEKRCPLSVT